MALRSILPLNLYDVLERSGLSTPLQILTMNVEDIKKITNLNSDDILLTKNIVASQCSPSSKRGNELNYLTSLETRVSTGCIKFDKALGGGFRKGTITELYGASGVGKTQVCIQAAVYNWPHGSVYICTEDIFPIKRFNQIMQHKEGCDSKIDYGKNVFVELLTESCDLLSCVRVRLPKLLNKGDITLIILDSVAGIFRTEYTDYIRRSEDLKELATNLIKLAQQYNVAVVCINQVTSSLKDNEEILQPSLGLAWSNMISTRLWLRKTLEQNTDKDNIPIQIRELVVIFAPDLKYSQTQLLITEKGIKG